MNVPKSVTFAFDADMVKAEMKYSLPEDRSGTAGATFGLKLADYPTIGACVQELMREMGMHARLVDDRYEAEARRDFFERGLAE